MQKTKDQNCHNIHEDLIFEDVYSLGCNYILFTVLFMSIVVCFLVNK